MYSRDIARLPIPIERNKYVQCIFELGWSYDLNSETLVNAVLLGDYFVSYSGIRTSYIWLEKKQKEQILLDLVPPVYSLELGYVVTVLSAKMYEDGYCDIKTVAYELGNYFVYKMEWEIAMLVNFNVRQNNIISSWALILGPTSNHLGSWIWDLTQEICLNTSLLEVSPLTILLAVKLLGKRLKTLSQHKNRIFELIIKQLAYEYEISIDELLKLYISSEKNQGNYNKKIICLE